MEGRQAEGLRDRPGDLLAVLSGAPADYFRLSGTANEVNGVTGTFSSTALARSWARWATPPRSFNGTNSYITGSGPSINTAESYTLSAWVYLTSKSSNKQILTVEGTLGTPFLFGDHGNVDRWRMQVCNADTGTPGCPGVLSTSSAIPQLNTWTHLVATVDAAAKKVKLYVDGESQGEAAFTTEFQAPDRHHRQGQVAGRAYADHWPAGWRRWRPIAAP